MGGVGLRVLDPSLGWAPNKGRADARVGGLYSTLFSTVAWEEVPVIL